MVQFTIESSFWRSCKPLVTAVERAARYAALPDFVIVVQELITQCLLANSEGINTALGKEEELQIAARTINDNANVIVIVGDCYEEDFGSCHVAHSSIYLNPGWIGQIQRVYEKGNDYHALLRVQLTLLVVKILHEYAHALTPSILKAELAIRVREAVHNPSVPTILHEVTPKIIGFKYSSKGTQNKGDMGFACEEILTKGFRFCAGQLESDNYAWDYANFELYSLEEETKRFVKCEAANYDELVMRISSSAEIELSEFHVERSSLQKKRKASHKARPQSRTSPGTQMRLWKQIAADSEEESEEEEEEEGYDETGFSTKYGPRESGGTRDRKV